MSAFDPQATLPFNLIAFTHQSESLRYPSRAKGEPMRRREFIIALGGAAWPLAVFAQHSDRVRRVGIVMPYAKGDAENEARILAFKQELGKLGWTEGLNLQFDEHWTTDNMDLVRAQAASLIASDPDVVVASAGRVIRILMQLSRSIPIVITGASDPVGVGYAKSLAHPGGNVTGFALFELTMLAKSLEILKQIAPTIVRVAIIYSADNTNIAIFRRSFEAASGPLGIEPVDAPIHELADIDRAVASLADTVNSGLFFIPDITTLGLRREVVDLVARHRCQQYIRILLS
jgi:putative tryptophan/tyrosine transport system substrate-binding protein